MSPYGIVTQVPCGAQLATKGEHGIQLCKALRRRVPVPPRYLCHPELRTVGCSVCTICTALRRDEHCLAWQCVWVEGLGHPLQHSWVGRLRPRKQVSGAIEL